MGHLVVCNTGYKGMGHLVVCNTGYKGMGHLVVCNTGYTLLNASYHVYCKSFKLN